MLNYRLMVCVQYNGFYYSGWQKQSFCDNSIQNIIEKCLLIYFKYNIKIFCSSRTDIGVHSLGQVFHFDIKYYININNFLFCINNILPKTIIFKWVKYICVNFHSRYNAIARRYMYIFCNKNNRSVFLENLVTYIDFNNLNINLMRKASKFILGKHNFNSFRSSKCESNNPYRRIFFLNIFKCGNYIFFDIKGNSFLYHMIRRIISCLLLIGFSKYSILWIKDFLYYRNNNIYNISLVKPNGLYLLYIYF